MLVTALVFLLILSLLVLIHEAGHFFVAKKLGLKVEEFGFGLPPRLWGKKKGETIYSINWLPIGGFVKLYGEDEAGAGRIATLKGEEKPASKADEKRAFYNRPIWQRTAVVIAGVVMNFSISSCHFALDSSVSFAIFGSFPVMWITASMLPRLVFAVFSHLWTSSGFLRFTIWEWNFPLMYSCNSFGVDSEIKHATLPPFFVTCCAKYSTRSASDFSVASIVKTTDLPVKSGWCTPGVVVPI